jgi:hyperosmotically inducible protein
MNTIRKGLLTASSLAVLFALGACGQRVDTASNEAAQPSVSTRTEQAANEAKQETREAAADTNTAVMGAGAAMGNKIDDAQIVTKVKGKFAADDEIKALSIDVDAKDGMVTLSGTVPSEKAKERASDLVRNTEDVKGLDNKLTVKG